MLAFCPSIIQFVAMQRKTIASYRMHFNIHRHWARSFNCATRAQARGRHAAWPIAATGGRGCSDRLAAAFTSLWFGFARPSRSPRSTRLGAARFAARLADSRRPGRWRVDVICMRACVRACVRACLPAYLRSICSVVHNLAFDSGRFPRCFLSPGELFATSALSASREANGVASFPFVYPFRFPIRSELVEIIPDRQSHRDTADDDSCQRDVGAETAWVSSRMSREHRALIVSSDSFLSVNPSSLVTRRKPRSNPHRMLPRSCGDLSGECAEGHVASPEGSTYLVLARAPRLRSIRSRLPHASPCRAREPSHPRAKRPRAADWFARAACSRFRRDSAST